MPPKKKKGKSKGGEKPGAANKAKKLVPPSQAPKVGEETQEFFLLQIKDLEERLSR